MRNIKKIAVFTFIVSLFMTRSTFSYADGYGHDGGHGHWHGHDRYSFGFNLSFAPDRYAYPYGYPYYYPYYYSPPNYIVVDSPDFQPVVVNGSTYYYNNGNYYVYTSSGYQPVSAPSVSVSSPAPIGVTRDAAANSDDSFTLNIPDDKGGYAPVVIKRAGKGFVGPQGEFYSEFPKVSQLKAMYCK